MSLHSLYELVDQLFEELDKSQHYNVFKFNLIRYTITSLTNYKQEIIKNIGNSVTELINAAVKKKFLTVPDDDTMKVFIDKLRSDLIKLNNSKSLHSLLLILKYVEVSTDYLRRFELLQFLFEDDLFVKNSLIDISLDFLHYYTFVTSFVESRVLDTLLENENVTSAVGSQVVEVSSPKIKSLICYGFDVSIKEDVAKLVIDNDIKLIQIHAIRKVIFDRTLELRTDLSIISPVWELCDVEENTNMIILNGKDGKDGYAKTEPHNLDKPGHDYNSPEEWANRWPNRAIGSKGVDGPSGWDGHDGDNGEDGKSFLGLGRKVYLNHESMLSADSLEIYSCGGKGGDAQNGQFGMNGQEGGPSGNVDNSEGHYTFTYFMHGGTGGDGGNGGNAGKRGLGGFGGKFFLSLALKNNRECELFFKNGKDGKNGDGGLPGSGGPAGSGSFSFSHGSPGLKGSDSPELPDITSRVNNVKPVSFYAIINYEQTLISYLYKKNFSKDIAFNLLHDIIKGQSMMFEVGEQLGIPGLIEELILIHECLYSRLFDAVEERICLNDEEVAKLYEAFLFKLFDFGRNYSQDQKDVNTLIGLCNSAFSATKTLQSSYTIINLDYLNYFTAVKVTTYDQIKANNDKLLSDQDFAKGIKDDITSAKLVLEKLNKFGEKYVNELDNTINKIEAQIKIEQAKNKEIAKKLKIASYLEIGSGVLSFRDDDSIFYVWLPVCGVEKHRQQVAYT